MDIDEINKLASAIGDIISSRLKDVLSLDEAASYMGLKKGSLYKLTSAKLIPHSKPNGKLIFFNRKDLDDWMLSNPVSTTADLNAAAQAYCMTKKSSL